MWRRTKSRLGQGISNAFRWSIRAQGISSDWRSRPVCQIKPPFVSDDQVDAILPVAGTLVALIVLLVILIV